MTFSNTYPTPKNDPPCLCHGEYAAPIRHQHNFRGIIEAATEIIETVSGVGTTSYSRCAAGYESNFKGIVQVLEDLNVSISGIIAGGSGTSGGNTNIIVGPSGTRPGETPASGNLWFNTQQGRLFVYVDDWYQTNAEGIALMGDTAPSPSGLSAPPRDGSLWYNTNTGSLFVFEEETTAWYEAGSTTRIARGVDAPLAMLTGEVWADTGTNKLRIWTGTSWASLS